MRLWLQLTCLALFFVFLKSCDAVCSKYYTTRYTCYKTSSYATYSNSCSGWWWGRRCSNQVNGYASKQVLSTCNRYNKCPNYYGWSSWGSWTSYGSCSSSYSYGYQNKNRYRTCGYSSTNCCYCGSKGRRGSQSYGQLCRNGGWSSWSSWSVYNSCSASCRKCRSSSLPYHYYKRSRSCSSPSPTGYGTSCSGSSLNYKTAYCNTHFCKVNGGWTEWASWGSWGSCSASCRTCGSSIIPRQTRKRLRSCTKPSPGCGGSSCSGSSYSQYSRYCNNVYCKVNGGWSSWAAWGSWGACTAACKPCGSSLNPYQTRRRYRYCNNPSPACQGASCSGSRYRTASRSCNTNYCSVDGGWSSWSSWKNFGSCSALCRKEGSTNPVQIIKRTRSCNNPSPGCNGKTCPGTSSQSSTKTCNTQYCPVNGGWSVFTSWSAWSVCSKSCDGGQRERYHTRSCTNPAPKHGGTRCTGKDKEIVRQSCNTFKCPSYCTCIGSGDPHYYTPDRAEIHFMGTCKYTLWKSVSQDDECAFRVETKNERRYGNTRVAYTRMIDFYIGDTNVRILKGGTTLINGVAIRIPASTSNNIVQVTMSGSFVTVVHSICNIRVQFDGNHMVDIKVPEERFGGNLTGICGNCNGVQSDDYKTKTGEDVSALGWGGYAKLGNSYKIPDNSDLPNANCADAEDPGKCSDRVKQLAKSNKYCGYLVSDSSPFRACRDSGRVDFSKMYSGCEFDVCSSNKKDVNCQTLESTALACSQHGYFVTWRTSSFCPKKCVGDFIYKTSISCTNTCENPFADRQCKDPPVDGCGCPDNTYLSGGKCVTIDKCGTCNLTISGISTKLAVDEVYPQGDCINKQKCKTVNGVFTLVLSKASRSCNSDEWCKPNSVGVYNCVKKPQHGYWEWGSWLQWDACSKTCESGVQKRIRYNKCIGPKHGGKPCSQKVPKTHTFHRGCNKNIPCPINGNWTAYDSWSEWSTCSYSCGAGLRQRTRARSCTNPKPQHGGNKCNGLAKETDFQDCNTFKCPSYCTCSGSGDPHYYTPDGAVIHFMGTCKYTLWQSTIPNDSCEFRVETKNERRYGYTHVAYTRMIDFYTGNTQVRILQGRNVLINSVAVSIPAWTANNTIEVTESGSYVTVVHSKCDLRVQFDGVHIVNIRVPENKFSGNLTGICGNCNKVTADDYSTKSGEKVRSWEYTKIGNSYKVKDDSDQPDLNCAKENTKLIKDPKPCTDAEKEKAKSDKFCGQLISSDSPFNKCRDAKKVDFTKMYSSCEFDVCSSDRSDANCQTLEGTALACSQHGYLVKWRNATFCPLKCNNGFVYKESVSCTNTCDNPSADRNCKDPPVDGCTCPDKTYLSRGKCVTLDKCGSCDLKKDGLFSKLALDDQYPKGDCIDSQKCNFINGTFKLVTVKAKSICKTGDWCTTNDHGVYECRKKPIHGGWTNYGPWTEWSTCSYSCGGGNRQRSRDRSCTNPIPQHGGNNCVGLAKETTVQSCNTFKCPSYCTCSGSGDPHYYTPDGAVIHFMGTCKYTLWQSTDPDDSCEFRVETKNEKRSRYSTVSWTRMIDFYMGSTQVRILKGGSVMINGVAVSIPSSIAGNTIQVTESGSYVTVVHSKCDIRVQFDGVHIVNIRVPVNNFAGNLTGICGNCNKVTADDYSMKSGEKVGSWEYAKIGNSYKVKDDSDQPDLKCATENVNNTVGTKPCTDAEKRKAKSNNLCGKLISKDSPFKECRDAKKVDFTKMYSSCEFDVCYSDRSDSHCQTLEGTALACSQHGYQVKWRNATFCPLKCKEGFVYKESVSCTNTCDNPKADRNCKDPPVDGCSCPDRTYLNGGKCVTLDKCGSCDLNKDGLFSKLAFDDQYPKGDCIDSQRCNFINGTFKLVNVKARTTCKSGDWCTTNDHGVYECRKKPIHGGWTSYSSWSEWSTCSRSCSGGNRQRTRARSCTNPLPQHGGRNCVGPSKETGAQNCNTYKCPSYCTCTGSGDPHYYTPDGAVIHFMGTCKYTLWQSTNPDDSCKFRVETKNEKRSSYSTVSWTRMIDFYMGSTQVRILKGGSVVINGVAVSIPSWTAGNTIQVTESGSYVTVVHSKCDIRVQFDGIHIINIRVPENKFAGNLTGICGNCNKVTADDYSTKSGEKVGSWEYAKIGNSYKVKDDSDQPDSNCVTGNNTSGTKPCTDVQTVKAKSDNFCGKLLSNKSPFKECRNAEKVDFTKMYSSCEFDVCYSDRYDAHCQTLEGTALACSQHGYHVKWRNATFCPLKCKDGFVYKESVSCTNTCDNPTADRNCKDPPVDGCTCPDKFYLSGGKCVTLDKCGSCDLNNEGLFSKLALDDQYPKGDCIDSQRCNYNNGTFKLVNVKAKTTCKSGDWCTTNADGIYECRKKPIHGGWISHSQWSEWSTCSLSCGGGTRQRTRARSCTNPLPQHGGKNCAGPPKEIATQTCNTYKCPSYCTCSVSGDPHYYTPDGAVIHFMGTCKYTLWQSTNPDDSCEFRVETKNEKCSRYSTVSWTRMIDFYKGSTQVRILKGGSVMINGVAVSIPSWTADNTIQVTESGSYVTVVHSKCNIRVQFDGVHIVNIRVPENNFAGNLTGICGNCNNITADDYSTKSGEKVGSLDYAKIGNSYKVKDNSDQPDSKCATENVNNTVGTKPCTDVEKRKAMSNNFCGKLISNDSPFKECRDAKKVDFSKMYSSCEFDVCYSNKSDAHCQTLEGTALACSQQGYRVKWRNATFCPLKCNDGLVYKESVSCTNTCDNPTADRNCKDPPVDGCTCPDKTFLSGGKCVTMDKCGSCDLDKDGLFSKLALNDTYPKGDCIDSQKCSFINESFVLMSVKGNTVCQSGDWCTTNDHGVYECTKKPIHGNWTSYSSWSEWSSCSQSCGGGKKQRTRSRSCTNPKPQYGGHKCSGSGLETDVQTCKTQNCPNYTMNCVMLPMNNKVGNDADWDRAQTKQQPNLEACQQFCLDSTQCLSVHYTEGYCFVYNKQTTIEMKAHAIYSLKNCTHKTAPGGLGNPISVTNIPRNTIKSSPKSNTGEQTKITSNIIGTTIIKPDTGSSFISATSETITMPEQHTNKDVMTTIGNPGQTASTESPSNGKPTKEYEYPKTTVFIDATSNRNVDSSDATVQQTTPRRQSSTPKVQEHLTSKFPGTDTQSLTTESVPSTTPSNTIGDNSKTTMAPIRTEYFTTEQLKTDITTLFSESYTTNKVVDQTITENEERTILVDQTRRPIVPTVTEYRTTVNNQKTDGLTETPNSSSETTLRATTSSLLGSSVSLTTDKQTTNGRVGTTHAVPLVSTTNGIMTTETFRPESTSIVIVEEPGLPESTAIQIQPTEDKNTFMTTKQLVTNAEVSTTSKPNETPDGGKTEAATIPGTLSSSTVNNGGVSGNTTPAWTTIPTADKIANAIPIVTDSSTDDSNSKTGENTTPTTTKAGTTEKKFKSTTQSTIDVTISTGPKDYGETTIIPGRTVVSSSGKNKNNDVRNETTTPTTTKAASAEKLKGMKCKTLFGYYPDPDNCAGFIQCNSGKPYKMPCAKGTIWSQAVLTCIHGKC